MVTRAHLAPALVLVLLLSACQESYPMPAAGGAPPAATTAPGVASAPAASPAAAPVATVGRAAATAAPAATIPAVATVRPDVAAGKALPTADEVAVLVAQGVDTRQVDPAAIERNQSDPNKTLPCGVTDGEWHCGDANAQRVVLSFGDSKAGQWAPALDAWGKEHGWRVEARTLTNCPTADFPYWDQTKKRRNTECDEFHAKVRDEVAQLHPDVVLLSSTYNGAMRAEKDGAPSDEPIADIWAAGLARTIAGVKPNAGRVVIIGDVPYRGTATNTQLPIDCLTSHADDIRPCNTPVKDAVQEDHNQAEAQIAAQNGAEYVDTVPWFCTATTCPQVVAGMIVPRDKGHASLAYTLWLRDVLVTAAGLSA